MLTREDWLQLCQRLQLSEMAQQVAGVIRASPPARHVQSRAGNVSVRYPSRKMGVTIQAESHRNELAGIYEKEHDPETLEYYDQPPPIKLVYLAKSGRQVGVWHTPDYFVIRRQVLGWEEWKLEGELVRLAEDRPHRYRRDEAGHWRCPPGEAYSETLGFFYRVRSSAEIDWVFQRNVLFLEDYLGGGRSAADQTITPGLVARVVAQPGLSLQAWLGEVKGIAAGATCDDLYGLIATGQVYVDLHAAPLAEPERVRVFSDETVAQTQASGPAPVEAGEAGDSGCLAVAPGVGLEWDGRRWTIVNAGATQITVLAEDGTLLELPQTAFEALVKQNRLRRWREAAPPGLHASAQELLVQASPADLAEANRRYALLAPRLAGQPIGAATTPARTLRHWLAAWRQAERLHGCGYVGLLPHRQKSGNRTPKLPARTLAAIETFIANDYETLKQKPRYAVFGALVRACETEGITAPSYKTFVQAIAGRPRHAQTLKRQGPRAAYQDAPFYHELTLTTPRHGDRPFEIAHIDHTELDVELVCSRTGRNLGRPWATFLSDAFSRCLLAVYLTFDPPSYRAAMMILRECVRRHARLPQIIVVDGGREFESLYFETLLARYECTKKTRPGAQPRFGSICERLFGTTNTRFIHNLLGNTQIMRQVRQVTQSVAPSELACWTLGHLYPRLCEWAYEVYPSLDHPALGQSPREAFAAGLAQAGERPQRLVSDDETWRMLTLPTTPKGTAKVMPGMGLKINSIYYWADAFRHPEVENTQVPLRFDPFDAGTAFAFVQGRWVRCVSEHYALLMGHSQRELMLATAELRRRHQRHAQQLAVTARKLADFLVSVEAEEVLLEQRLRDAEARDVWAQINASDHAEGQETSASPVQPPQPACAPARANPVEELVVYGDY
jgi:putative transposase